MVNSVHELNAEHHRLRLHLNLLEKNPTHPLDFSVDNSHGSPGLVLREGERLNSAHSGVGLSYELMRQLLMEALRTRISELDERLCGTKGTNRPIEHLQFGDQTEA